MIPSERVVAASDVILLHGNGVPTPAGLAEVVGRVRGLPTYRPMPILFNEDDNHDFDKPTNDLVVAVSQHASWGLYDPGPGARGYHVRSDYVDGFQNVPPYRKQLHQRGRRRLMQVCVRPRSLRLYAAVSKYRATIASSVARSWPDYAQGSRSR
jgi:hypothetical protein